MTAYDLAVFGGTFRGTLRKMGGDAAWSEVERARRLEEVLDHAVATVPYYRGLGLRAEDGLQAFPVVDKERIRGQQRAFVSDAVRPRRLRRIATSGSTGTPFVLAMDTAKLGCRTAEVLFFNQRAGFRVGQHHTLHAVAASKSRIRRLLQNQRLTNPSHLDDAWLETELRAMVRQRVAFCVAYASALAELARRALALGLGPADFALAGVVAVSERLDERTRRMAEAAFGCPVVGRYSSLETGVIAQECLAERRFHLNDANYLVEVLELERDVPAAAGTVGRVVITDLWGRGTPLVRYDIGDLAVRSADRCACGLPGATLERIEGRIVENIRDTAGRWVSWVALSDPLWGAPGVESFQFSQEAPRRYRLAWTGDPAGCDAEALRADMVAILGEDAAVTVSHVEALPQTPSGKRQYVLARTR